MARLCQPSMEPRTIETIKQTLALLAVEHPHHTIPPLVPVLHSSPTSLSYGFCVKNVGDIIGGLNTHEAVDLVNQYRAFFGP